MKRPNLDGNLAAGVGLVFVWVERRQQLELRGLHAVPVAAVPVHGHLPGAEFSEHTPAAAGARGRLAVVLVRGCGRKEGRRGDQDSKEPHRAGDARIEDSWSGRESLEIGQVSHTAAAAWRPRRRPSPAWLGLGTFASARERQELTRLPLCLRGAPWAGEGCSGILAERTGEHDLVFFQKKFF